MTRLPATLLLVASIPLFAAPLVAAEKVDFQRDIEPILTKYCAGCHNVDDAEAGFALDTAAGILAGGESGPSVTPGTPASSRLWLMASGAMEPRMPPEDEPQLSDEHLEMIVAWIEQGAEVGGDESIKRPLRTPTIASKAGVAKPVTAMAVTRDGTLRAVARFGKIELLNDQASSLKVITGDLGKVNSLQFDRSGTRLLVATGTTGAYGAAEIYDVESGQRIRELLGHRDILYAARFSPDESIVATAGYDRQIKLWNTETGEPLRALSGHNGAIFDLAFSPDGKVLVSACADETAKVWGVQSGERLDTLSQSEGEVFAVDVTGDGKHIVAASADNRLRVWSLVSQNKPGINPLLVTRFVDESPLVNFGITPDGAALVVLSQSGNVKVIRTGDWSQAATLDEVGESASDLTVSPDGTFVDISLMNGEVVRRRLPQISPTAEPARRNFESSVDPLYLDLGESPQVSETDLRETQGQEIVDVKRGVVIRGAIDKADQADRYRWTARRGEVWAIDADADDKSPIDTFIAVLDADDSPVLRTRLQAVRESYFTFRGKDSKQTTDFRLFNWQLMDLNSYLYAAGEVTRLFTHPRGPDSGFNVYPDEGNRWTYFGTSHRAHALGEPAYIVEPIGVDQTPTANGLPVFDVVYENDDDPLRVAGKNSRVLFTAPADGQYTIEITDTRGEGGANYRYRLAIRAAEPGFRASFEKPKETILKGTGRDFKVRVDRMDGFDGPVTFEMVDLPAGLISNSPITVEPGHRFAIANLWADESVPAWDGPQSVRVVAHAMIDGRYVERDAGTIDKLKIGDRPNAIPSVHPIDREVPENEPWTLQVRRGETATARILVRRKEGFEDEIRFGNEQSGRNTAHGVYVDNIGLSGLLVRRNERVREFFLTADPIAQPGKRQFHLQGRIDGNVTTYPIVVEVLP